MLGGFAIHVFFMINIESNLGLLKTRKMVLYCSHFIFIYLGACTFSKRWL
jgi:hypothetical protein